MKGILAHCTTLFGTLSVICTNNNCYLSTLLRGSQTLWLYFRKPFNFKWGNGKKEVPRFMMHLYRWQKPSLSAFSWCIIVLVGDGCLYLVLLWKMHFFLHPSLFLTADIREVWQWQRWIKQLRKAIYHPKWFSCELVGMEWPCEKAFFISIPDSSSFNSKKGKTFSIGCYEKDPEIHFDSRKIFEKLF